MQKIMVIGPGGGGKTTFCRQLGEILDVPVYGMDKLQFQAGWKLSPEVTVLSAHQGILQKTRWIIDGFGPQISIEERILHADTAIIIQYPLWRHFWWTFKRQVKGIFRTNLDFPDGCTVWPLWRCVFHWTYCAHQKLVPGYLELVRARHSGVTLYWVQTPSELAGVLDVAKQSRQANPRETVREPALV